MSTHAAMPSDVPTASPPAWRSGALLAGLAALMLCARLPAYLVNENVLGDAVPRTELARRWAEAPHWMSSFADGALQFGPLHLYAVGAALKLGVSKEKAGPLTSLLFGTLTVLPLAVLTRRLFGEVAALWSGVALSLWGLHIQLSTTGASEALALLLALTALALFDPGKPRRLVASGLVLTLACAVRYDAWLLVPLLSLVALAHGEDRRAALGRAVLFGLCCLPFPLAWMIGNARALGDPLYPVRYVEDFHRHWVAQELQQHGEWSSRWQNLGFWPGVAVLTLGPVASAAGFAGMGWAFRARRDARWLLWTAWVPAAYFTFRGAVLLDFAPLVRFTVGQLALVLPFLKPGADLLLRRAPPRLARAAAALGVASMVGLTGWMAAVSWEPGRVGRALASVSPLSRHPPEVRRLVELFGAQRVEEWEPVVLDQDPSGYRDLLVAFALRHPEPRIIRRRWPDYQERLGWFTPMWLIRFEGGPLETSPGVELNGAAVRLGERWFDEVPGALPPLRLYRARR